MNVFIIFISNITVTQKTFPSNNWINNIDVANTTSTNFRVTLHGLFCDVQVPDLEIRNWDNSGTTYTSGADSIVVTPVREIESGIQGTFDLKYTHTDGEIFTAKGNYN